jgi:hypothetical protein
MACVTGRGIKPLSMIGLDFLQVTAVLRRELETRSLRLLTHEVIPAFK